MALVIAVVAVLAFLAWSRHLHNKEVMLLVEKGGDWHSFLEMRERWRIRNGMLLGATLLGFGLALVVGAILAVTVRLPGSPEELRGIAFGLTLGGVLFGVVGAVVFVAHIVWARSARVMSARQQMTAANSERSGTNEPEQEV